MIKNLKDFYKKNRVYSILMIVSMICIIAIMVGIILYFLGQTSKEKYGNRLEGISSVKISDKKKKETKESILSNELVDNVEINIKGRLIYINIELLNGKHSDAEALATTILELFSDEKNYYDMQFIIENKDKDETENFPIMGYIKKGNEVIKWTNYVEEVTTDEKA